MTSVYSRLSFCFLLISFSIAIISPTASPNAIGDADREVFRYIHEDMKNGFFDTTLPVIQDMGHSQFYTATCMLLCAFGDEKMEETGKLAAAAFMEAGFVAYALKRLVGRPRPLNESETNSFPSGHTTLAFAMATVAGYEYTRLRIPLYAGALATAFARVYLGRHYPSDVLAGAIIGTLTGLQMIHYRKTILNFSF